MWKALKTLLIGIPFALLLMAAQCTAPTPDQTTQTLQQIQDAVKATCGYLPTIQSIAAVAATVTSVIDPAAGATATVAVSIGTTITTDICKAVQAQQAVQAQGGKPKAAAPGDYTVVVNGVVVHGTLVAP